MKKSSSKVRATRPRAASLWAYAGSVAVAGIAALGLVTAVVLVNILPAARQALDGQARDIHGYGYTALFNGRLSELSRLMNAAAGAPVVRDALQGRDAAAIREARDLLNDVLDFAQRIEIYLPGTAALDMEAEVPISYAALDIVRRAEAGRFVGPEAIEGARKAIYVAQPVEIDGAVAGVVFAAVAPAFFLDPLAEFSPSDGRLTLEQAFDGADAISILTWGEAGGSTTSRRFELAASYWTLVYEPGPSVLPPAVGPETARYGLLAALVLFCAGVIATFLHLTGSLRHDAALVCDRLLNTAAANSTGSFRLAALAQLADRLRAGGAAGRERTAAHRVEAPAVESTAEPPGALLPAHSTGESPADGLLAPHGSGEPGAGAAAVLTTRVEPGIFGACDIRGNTTGELTEASVYWIGRALAAQARACDEPRVAVGRDGRHSSPGLASALLRGLSAGGIDAVDIGVVPTPMLYFATHALETGSGVMITGSHHPPEFNGLKMMIGGETLAGPGIQALRERIEQDTLTEGAGNIRVIDLREAYLERIVTDVVVAQPLRIVVDGGNGVAGGIVADLIKRLDCTVIPLYCDANADFPNHPPDPAEPRNLEDLITVVKAERADLGLAFDGDGGRIGVVTDSGRVVWPDKLLMLFAQDIVGRNPGADIVYDVACSRHLNTVISELGGRPIMWKSGSADIKAKLRETGALLGGGFSGHVCFGERWYGFEDAVYAAARLLEILGAAHESADALFAQFPQTFGTSELEIRTTDRVKLAIMESLSRDADFGGGTLTTIDGIRVDYEDGWGLIRPSNTSPALKLRFEADDAPALDRIQAIFAGQLARIDADLKFR